MKSVKIDAFTGCYSTDGVVSVDTVTIDVAIVVVDVVAVGLSEKL